MGDGQPRLLDQVRDRIRRKEAPARLPVVLTQQAVESIFAHLSGTVWLMIRLLYGTGMISAMAFTLRLEPRPRYRLGARRLPEPPPWGPCLLKAAKPVEEV